ncbi:MAG: acetyl-CoA acetyltransferase [Alphaproteobacteria bacterium]
MTDPRTPVLVGVAQYTQKTDPTRSLTAMQMVEQAARGALADTGARAGEAALIEALDTVLVVGFTVDAPDIAIGNLPKPTNPPRSLGKALGTRPKREIYTYMGGNTPQMAVNRLAQDIAEGTCEAAILSGAEFLNSYLKLARAGEDLAAWGVEDGTPGIVWGDPRPGTLDFETAHGLNFPVNTYPLFENAIRHVRGRTVEEHNAAIGRLFSPFSAVAARNPHAWFPTRRSPEEIATVTPDNRYVGFPYTKYMNAIIQVDQMAGLVMMSAGKARALGIPESKWVYLHGCADATDHFHVIERADFHSSPAIKAMGERAFAMAGWSVDDLDTIDLYSCFPSAVELACEALGLAETDPRGLTVTGGLPYFGGPGNNYVMHSIVSTVERLRASGKADARGLVTANGWYITKHAIGLYGTKPPAGPFEREAPAVLQAQIDRMPKADYVREPVGPARIETYTVVHDRKGPRMGLVMGRLQADDRRFVALTPDDDRTALQSLMDQDGIGRPGIVVSHDGGLRNVFTLA